MSAADPFGLVGQVLDGQFRVDKLVGEGGFSAVYRGHHQGLNEPIAIKCLKLPAALGTSLVDTFVQRFRDESRILYRLSQGNLHVVRSIAAGTTQAPATGALVPYMVLEWLEGRSVQNDFTVRRTVGEKGRSIADVVKLFETAADGLAYAHAQGVVHRDLNPGNLFLASTQHGVKMKVLDFGVAKLMHDGALNLGPRAQTVGQIKIFAPAYGAPEQFDDRIGAVGAASDVYSFALVLLEALRDKNVVEGTHLGEFAKATCDPQRRPTPRALGIDVPDEVEQTFARATALHPAQRWNSAGDFWQSLTIALKIATERKYEEAARETPPLAMGGVPGTPALEPKSAAIGGKTPLARTMPLGSSMPGLPRPAPGASRPRVPTTIGIPAPASAPASAPRAAAVQAPVPQAAPLAPPAAPSRVSSRPPRPPSAPRMPAVPHLPPLGAPPSVARPASDRPAPSPETARFPSAAASAPAAAPAPAPEPAPPRKAAGFSEDDDDEATKVHAPAPDLLQTLALHQAVAARNAVAMARVAGHGAESAAEPAPKVAPVPPSLGGTLMMSPTAPSPGATAAAPAEVAGGHGSTVAMMAPAVQTPGVGFTPASAHGQGSAIVPSTHSYQLQPPQQPQPPQHHQHPPHYAQQPQPGSTAPFGVPAQGSAPFARPSMTDQPLSPPSFAQAADASGAPKSSLPIVPIAIGLGVLALGGIGLGVFAMRARHASPRDPIATSDSASASSAAPVPVPVAEDPPPVPSAATEVDAAPAAVEEEAPDAAAAAAAAPSASAAPTTATTASGPQLPSPPPTTAFAPAPTASAKPAVDPNAFNEGAARTRLSQANGVLVICKKEGGVTGPGNASVTFANDGTVSGVSIDPPYAGTKEGDCAANQFRRAKVTAFTGAPQTVRHSFDVPK